MSVALVQSNFLVLNKWYDPDSGSYDGPYTISMPNVSAGNTLVVLLGSEDNNYSANLVSFTVSDDKANSWTHGTMVANNDNSASNMAHVVSAASGTTVVDVELQHTSNGNLDGAGFWCAEFSGVASVGLLEGTASTGGGNHPIYTTGQDVAIGDMLLANVANDRGTRTLSWVTSGVTDVSTGYNWWLIGHKGFASAQLGQNMEFNTNGFGRHSHHAIHLVAGATSSGYPGNVRFI